MKETILCACRKGFRGIVEGYIPRLPAEEVKEKVDEEIATRTRQSELRKHYRNLLQEHMRPELRNEDNDSISKLRTIYPRLLSQEPGMQKMFDDFYFVRYSDFKHN